MSALFDKLEARPRIRWWLEKRSRTGRNERREIYGQYKGESVQRWRLVFVRTLDLAFARFVQMGAIVTVSVQVRVNEGGVAITMDVLKRRQNKGGHECQTALER
jgi:hypothetical protein